MRDQFAAMGAGRRKPTRHGVEKEDAGPHSVVLPSTGMADDGQRPVQMVVDGHDEVIICKNVRTLLTNRGENVNWGTLKVQAVAQPGQCLRR